MKALSLLQPWASLVVMGSKKFETRSWNTGHRGDLLIHASTGKAGALLAAEAPFPKYISDYNRLPFGAIIGKVILTDVVRIENLSLPDAVINRLTLEEKAFGEYAKGRYVWILEEPVQFERPVFVKGAIGLWEYNGELYL